jgi:hypothetical protein
MRPRPDVNDNTRLAGLARDVSWTGKHSPELRVQVSMPKTISARPTRRRGNPNLFRIRALRAKAKPR